MLVSNFECALCKKKHFSPQGLETNLPVQPNKFVLNLLDQYNDWLQVTCDLNPGQLVEWYNVDTKAIISTAASGEAKNSFSNCEKIKPERVLGILNQSLEILTKFLDKITHLVKDLRSFTQLDLTLRASEFLAMCS